MLINGIETEPLQSCQPLLALYPTRAYELYMPYGLLLLFSIFCNDLSYLRYHYTMLYQLTESNVFQLLLHQRCSHPSNFCHVYEDIKRYEDKRLNKIANTKC